MKLIDILQADPNLNHQNHLVGTDKNTIHNYINGFYETEFSKYKDKEISLLEIGISSGGSLYLWSKYFSNAMIYGIDVSDAIRPEYRNINNVKHIFTNAYNLNILNLLPDFDIIIDDGPHSLESQIFSIKYYLNKLKSGGVLIIEDVQDEKHFDILKGEVPFNLSQNTEYVNLIKDKGRYDDLMFIVRK